MTEGYQGGGSTPENGGESRVVQLVANIPANLPANPTTSVEVLTSAGGVFDDILNLFYNKYDGTSIAMALGVLELVKHRLISDQAEEEI